MAVEKMDIHTHSASQDSKWLQHFIYILSSFGAFLLPRYIYEATKAAFYCVTHCCSEIIVTHKARIRTLQFGLIVVKEFENFGKFNFVVVT